MNILRIQFARFASVVTFPVLVCAAMGCAGGSSEPADSEGEATTAGVSESTEDSSEEAPMGESSEAGDIVANPSGAPAEVKTGEPEFTLSAEEICKEYAADSIKAEEKYQMKWVQLEGTVAGVAHDLSGSSLIKLAGGESEQGMPLEPMCMTTVSDPWETVTPGQTVSVVGRIDAEILGSPLLSECVIVKVEGEPSPAFSSAEWGSKFNDGRDDAIDKHSGQFVILTGEIIKKEVDDIGTVALALKTSGETSVTCNFAAWEGDFAGAQKEGDTVRILGQFDDILSDEGTADLYFCVVMKPKSE